MAINVGPSMGQTLPPGGPRPAPPRQQKPKPKKGMVSSHGPGSGAPPTARRQPTGMISSHGPGSGAPPTAMGLPRISGPITPGGPTNLPRQPDYYPQFGNTGFMGGQPGASPVPQTMPAPTPNPMMDMGGVAMEGPGIDTGPSMQYDTTQMNPNSGIAGPMGGSMAAGGFMGGQNPGGMWGNIFNKMSQNQQMGPMGGAGGILSRLYGGGGGRGMFGGLFGR